MQPQRPSGKPRDMKMPRMRRIERPAEQAHPDAATVSEPRQTGCQGRTWPVPVIR